jgi:hypothetical protein
MQREVMNMMVLAKELELVTMENFTAFNLHFRRNLSYPICTISTINPILICKIQCPDNTITIDVLQTIHKKGASYHPRA